MCQPGDIVFESVRLKSSNKKGIIKADEEGCYTQVIGALGAYNSSGDFYDLEAGKQFFLSQSSFQRKIAKGVLRAEYGHPKRTPGMSMMEYGMRVMQIAETLCCGTWRQIWLSRESLRDDRGRSVIPIMGRIKPSGPYGPALKEAFEEPGEQVCFSIRSFTNDTPQPGGGSLKKLINIISFDYVNEPGMYNAEKLLSPTLESIDSHLFKAETLVKSMREMSSASMESFALYDFEEKLNEIIEKENYQLKKKRFIHW